MTLVALVALLATACSPSQPAAPAPAPPLPPAEPIPSDADAVEQSIRYLENKVKDNPDDFIAYNKLAGYYLQRLRETGDLTYLSLASRAANSSLDVIPAEDNVGGLGALAGTEFSSHEFAAARDHAKQLMTLDPRKSYPLLMLGDALLELGDYDAAVDAFKQIERRSDDTPGDAMNLEMRLARLAQLQGKPADATRHFTTALSYAVTLDPVPRETVAWCRWQLGETAFSIGDYAAAEQHYRDSLTTFPNYYRAVASLGRVLAARGDMAGAIEQYEHAVKLLPDPTFVAALGDLYKLAGRDKDAAAQYDLVERIGHLSEVNGVLYNRQLALFYADHDLKPDVAYEQASKEYEARHDIYGSDAVAWTALKAGKLPEAQAAIKEAMRLGTQDARLFYHAGMIARAAGDASSGRGFLQRALQLNPQFDPLQAAAAQRALAE